MPPEQVGFLGCSGCGGQHVVVESVDLAIAVLGGVLGRRSSPAGVGIQVIARKCAIAILIGIDGSGDAVDGYG